MDLSFLPLIARRKLSKLDRISLCAMNMAFESYKGPEPKLVFASKYGEIERLDKIISQYLESDEVSPTAFCSSVHNSVVGQFSLLKKINKSYNSIAADNNTFSAGLLEAVLSSADDNVLYCFADSYEKLEAFSCIISIKPSVGAIDCELVNTGAKRDFVNEVEEFWMFLSDRGKDFCSNDGLFWVKRC